ncbi:MAG: aminomethyltransferase family protein [Planctomycetota bacterium]|jgi:folate-binding protein YgfZ|nr:aminomethyltransferase family protein [Planctomycetota bacterium]MDP6504434.1 aminomethyltransferase family protein [Planctomycetota bacterium]
MSEPHESPIHARHKADGASFKEFRGATVPSSYGDAAAEHGAIRNGAGIVDRSYLSKLQFTGADANDYLQRMTSNEVVDIEPGTGNHGALLTDRGKLIADFRLFKSEEHLRIHFDHLQRQTLLVPLEKFIITDDVTITDLSDTQAIFGVYGPRSGELLSSVFNLDMGEREDFSHFEVFFAGEDLLVASQHITGESGFEIWAPDELAEELWSALISAAPSHDALPAGHDAFELARLEAGVPLFGIDMDENTIPNEAGLEHAASVTKGCYIGQEIISRIYHLGHVNRLLRGLKFTSDIAAAGAKVKAEEKEIGTVTSAASSPSVGSGIGLAILRSRFAAPGREVNVEWDGQQTTAEIVDLPFLTP